MPEIKGFLEIAPSARDVNRRMMNMYTVCGEIVV